MLKITVLIENFAPDHLICEHGLSLHLEYNGHFYLLDGGTPASLPRTPAAWAST